MLEIHQETFVAHIWPNSVLYTLDTIKLNLFRRLEQNLRFLLKPSMSTTYRQLHNQQSIERDVKRNQSNLSWGLRKMTLTNKPWRVTSRGGRFQNVVIAISREEDNTSGRASFGAKMASNEAVLLKSTLEIHGKSYSVKLTSSEIYWELITSARAAGGPYSEPLVSKYGLILYLGCWVRGLGDRGSVCELRLAQGRAHGYAPRTCVLDPSYTYIRRPVTLFVNSSQSKLGTHYVTPTRITLKKVKNWMIFPSNWAWLIHEFGDHHQSSREKVSQGGCGSITAVICHPWP